VSDLIERLRKLAEEWQLPEASQAAAEIERLSREHNRRLDESYHASMERDRFRNDNERLTRERDEARAHLAYGVSTGDECSIEVDALRKHNERLRAALERIATNGSDARIPPLDRYELAAIAREALKL
jgi:hypothetical protein